MLRAGQSSLRKAPLAVARWLATAADASNIYRVEVQATGQGATTLCKKDEFSFLVDQPAQMGGSNTGPNALTTFLGGLLGCTQFTLGMMAQQAGVSIARVAWETAGQVDLRTLMGDLPEEESGFQKISVVGTVDCEGSQKQLDQLAELVERKCIVAATLRRVPGLELTLQLRKGAVDADADLNAAISSNK